MVDFTYIQPNLKKFLKEFKEKMRRGRSFFRVKKKGREEKSILMDLE